MKQVFLVIDKQSGDEPVWRQATTENKAFIHMIFDSAGDALKAIQEHVNDVSAEITAGQLDEDCRAFLSDYDVNESWLINPWAPEEYQVVVSQYCGDVYVLPRSAENWTKHITFNKNILEFMRDFSCEVNPDYTFQEISFFELVLGLDAAHYYKWSETDEIEEKSDSERVYSKLFWSWYIGTGFAVADISSHCEEGELDNLMAQFFVENPQLTEMGEDQAKEYTAGKNSDVFVLWYIESTIKKLA